MSFTSIIIILIATFILIPYFAVPVLLKRRQYINANPELILTDASSLPSQAMDFFQEHEQQLTPLGFIRIGYLHIPDLTDIQDWYHALYIHQEHQDSAALFYMTQEMPDEKIEHFQFIEFNTQFSNGSEVSITTSPIADIHGMCPEKHLIQIPLSVRLSRLYRLHTELKIYYGKGEPAYLPDETMVLDEIRRTLKQLMHCTVNSGYQFYDSDADCFRPTWKGAIANGWMNIYPWNKLKQASVKRRAQKLIDTV